jgi:hypothetical protein
MSDRDCGCGTADTCPAWPDPNRGPRLDAGYRDLVAHLKAQTARELEELAQRNSAAGWNVAPAPQANVDGRAR